MSAYGSFKRKTSNSSKGQLTGFLDTYQHNISEIQQHKLRDQLEQEVKNLRTNFANLEALQHNTKVLPVLNHFLLCYEVALVYFDVKPYRTT